ncbi:MAG: FAD/NAD(P)-binding:oxidoreductase [Calditrichaeota bacterium]|nr:MAG: FAD/NAD(P)-binding:oxidoreductase [Calditrichota bacterium]
MIEYTKKDYVIPATGFFVGLPLLLYVLGDFARRTVLKESLSVLFILTYSLMLGLFFLSRSNKKAVKTFRMSKLIKYHKIIGYLAVIIFFVHPLLLVTPRFFEAGVAPMDAFVTIITTFDSLGVILGITAWFLMLSLGVISFFRNRLSLNYISWRYVHGILAMVFVAVATWHVINLGRHANLAMSIYLITITTGSEMLILKTYFFKPAKVRLAKNNEKPK